MTADEIYSAVYAAAAKRLQWEEPLNRICQALGLWACQMVGVDKRRGGLIFSAGSTFTKPEIELDYIRFYHAINPRVRPSLQLAPDQWMHCHQVFDDAFVARDRFYQEFLIPYGGRYLSGTKLVEDDEVVFFLGILRGVGAAPIGPAEMPFLQSLKHHVTEALRNHLELRKAYAEVEMARALFAQFRHPMILVDENRGIWHCNSAAREFLAGGRVLLDEAGMLLCRSASENNQLTEAIRSLQLRQQCDDTQLARRVVTSRGKDGHPVRLFISAIRPDHCMQAFGPAPKALVIIHEECSAQDALDPLLLAECFSLTPAEARVAAKLASGLTIKEISSLHQTAVSTVRTQVQQVLVKAGVERQADLVRLLASMPLQTPVSS
jgi:DNA-binding CsgD family transcriptional regulator/PAS domain-containing protein